MLSRFTLRLHGICLQPVQNKLMSVLMIVGIHHTWAACKAGKFASICFSAITQQIPFLKIEAFFAPNFCFIDAIHLVFAINGGVAM